MTTRVPGHETLGPAREELALHDARGDARSQPGSPVAGPVLLLRLEPGPLGHQEALPLRDHVEAVLAQQAAHALCGPARQVGGAPGPRFRRGPPARAGWQPAP